MSKPRVLFIDIETGLHTVKTFGLRNQFISPKQIVTPSRVLCFAARWEGDETMQFYSEWGDGADYMIERAHELMDSADAIVTYNGVQFDCKHLNREFVQRGWEMPSEYSDIDLLKTVRKRFAFASNKLDYICQELGLDVKVPTGGIQLWMDIDDGVHEAQSLMEEYNCTDVAIMEELYKTIQGWTVTQFNRGLFADDTNSDTPICPSCGSDHVTRNGVKRTKLRTYQRFQCQDCGAALRGRKSLRNENDERVVVSL